MAVRLIQHRYPHHKSNLSGVEPGSQKIVFADPPYNIGIEYAEDPTRDRMDPSIYRGFCRTTMLTLSQYLMPGGTMWWLCPPAHVAFIPELLKETVGEQRYMIIKTETFAQYQQTSLTEDYRLLFCYLKPGGTPTFNPDAIRIPSKRQELGDKRADPKGRVPGQIWEIRRLQGTSDDRVKWHPAQVAPELLHRIIKGWSNEGDSVLDGFAGSGNMGVAAQALKRESILVEASSTYCREIRNRLSL